MWMHSVLVCVGRPSICSSYTLLTRLSSANQKLSIKCTWQLFEFGLSCAMIILSWHKHVKDNCLFRVSICTNRFYYRMRLRRKGSEQGYYRIIGTQCLWQHKYRVIQGRWSDHFYIFRLGFRRWSRNVCMSFVSFGILTALFFKLFEKVAVLSFFDADVTFSIGVIGPFIAFSKFVNGVHILRARKPDACSAYLAAMPWRSLSNLYAISPRYFGQR